MTDKNQDFEMVSGDSKTLKFTIYNADGSVKDLSGVTDMKWKLETGVVSTTILKSLGSGVTITSAPNGLVEVVLDKTDTEDILGGSYNHELEAEDSAGNVVTLAIGRASIIEDIIE